MILNRIYETQNLLSLKLVSFLVGLRTYQHPCIWLKGVTTMYRYNYKTSILVTLAISVTKFTDSCMSRCKQHNSLCCSV